MKISEARLKERLRKLLTSPLTMKEILTKLKVPSQDRKNMRRRIRAIADEGLIVKIKGNRYGLPDKMNLVTGVVQRHPDGFGFIIPDDPTESDVYVGWRGFNEAMHGDKVVCRVEHTRSDGRREGSVIRIIERAYEEIAGTFEGMRGGGYLVPLDRRIAQDIYIPAGSSMKARNGQAVVAKITEYPSKWRQPSGRVVRILGEPTDPAVEIEIEIVKHQLRSEFSAKVLNEAKRLSAPSKKDMNGRLDLRGRTIVTIDGETAKDFDDAVEVERLDGGWRLGVHIADVTHYVGEGCALDKEAEARGTSVYFPGTVIPMLPFELSNDLCSLNPKVDRLTLSCLMTFDKRGGMTGYEVHESVIRSAERMTYTAVAAILEKNDPDMKDRYSGLVGKFQMMEELAAVLRQRRMSAGALDFDLPEPEIILDVTGRPESIILAERNVAHRIIEEFMLSANKAVARYLMESEYPAIFRVHDKPDPVKLEVFKDFVAAFGLWMGKGGGVTAQKLQKILKAVEGRPEEKLITHIMLRSMKQARYSTENIGHFGLAFDHYTHFTSPIRRYPDLVVHRLLKDLVRKKRRDAHWAERLPKIADHCSMAERKAEDAERSVVKLRQTQYMAQHIGDEFDGIISGVTSFGFFVEIIEPLVEGLVRVTSMFDDYYHFDENGHALIGERTGKKYRLGDKVRIEVADVSVERRQIDFKLIGSLGEEEETRPKERVPRKTGKRPAGKKRVRGARKRREKKPLKRKRK